MALPKQISKLVRDVYFGGNWTDVNLKDALADVAWQDATAKVHGLNTIAALVFHINYFVAPVLKVLQGAPLTGSDKFSFDLLTKRSEKYWRATNILINRRFVFISMASAAF